MMKKTFLKHISYLLCFSFFIGQLQWPAFAQQNLAASYLSDENLNPQRTQDGRSDLAGDVFKGSVGKGQLLVDLLENKKPLKIEIDQKDPRIVYTVEKIREAIDLALFMYVKNKDMVPQEFRKKAEQASLNLTEFQVHLNKLLHLFKDQVKDPKNYLLAFTYLKEARGLDIDLVDFLYEQSPLRLAQLVFHECIPEDLKVIDDGKEKWVDREDHKNIIKNIQTYIYGYSEVVALGRNIRFFKNKALIPSLDERRARKAKLVQNTARPEQPTGMKPQVFDLFPGANRPKNFKINRDHIAVDAKVHIARQTPDRKVVAAGHSNGEVVVYYYDKETCIRSQVLDKCLPGNTYDDNNAVFALDVSDDGKYIVAAGKEIRFYVYNENLDRYDLVKKDYVQDRIQTSVWQVKRLKLSPDGKKLLAGYTSGRVALYELAGGEFKKKRVFFDHKYVISDLKFFPDNKSFITCDKGQVVKFYQMEDGEYEAQPLPQTPVQHGIRQSIDSSDISYDGNKILLGMQAAVHLLVRDERTGKFELADSFYEHDPEDNTQNRVHAVKFSPKATKFMSISDEKECCIYQQDIEGIYRLKSKEKLPGKALLMFSVNIGALGKELIISNNLLDEGFVEYYSYDEGRSRIAPLEDEEPEKDENLSGEDDLSDVRSAEVLAYRKEILKNLLNMLNKDPDKKIVLAIDSDIAKEQKRISSTISPVWTALNQIIMEIESIKDKSSDSIFKNITIIKESASSRKLSRSIENLISTSEGTLPDKERVDPNNVFLLVRNSNYKYVSDVHKKGIWMTRMEDVNCIIDGEKGMKGQYMPVVESGVMLSIMIALGADESSIKRFYNSISDNQITLVALKKMLDGKNIYILPKMNYMDLGELRKVYKRACAFDFSA